MPATLAFGGQFWIGHVSPPGGSLN
jgi:hypothetical protein